MSRQSFRIVATLTLMVATVAAVGCGDDDEPGPSNNANNPANNSTNNPTNNSTNNPTNNSTNNPTNNSTNNPTNNSTNNPTNNPAECAALNVAFDGPVGGETVDPLADIDPVTTGVQVDFSFRTNAPNGAVLTVDNVTSGESFGTLVTGSDVVVSAVGLVEGANELEAFVDTESCSVSDAATVTLDPGTPCVDDGQCGLGELCEAPGLCQPCTSSCSSDAQCTGGTCVNACFCTTPYVYVLVEDLSDAASGASPGADIDAIELRKSSGSSFYALEVIASNIGGGSSNDFDQPSESLGAPDAACQVQNFVALGGEPNNGWIIVGFGEGVVIEEGDTVVVYEVGRLLCPSNGYLDDPYLVSVSTSSSPDTFVELGAGGASTNEISVTTLP